MFDALLGRAFGRVAIDVSRQRHFFSTSSFFSMAIMPLAIAAYQILPLVEIVPMHPGTFTIMDNIEAAAGKRKTTSDDADAASASLFAWLPETAWHQIATYAIPPDVYNLCLSSVHFFHEISVSSADAEKKCGVRRSKRLAAASSSSDKKQNLLATNLLRTSLLSSLGRVLEESECGITLDAVLKIGALPEGSALIAGSTIVAACLGKYDWKGDVDVYCSAEGAPEVRSVRNYHFDVPDFFAMN